MATIPRGLVVGHYKRAAKEVTLTMRESTAEDLRKLLGHYLLGDERVGALHDALLMALSERPPATMPAPRPGGYSAPGKSAKNRDPTKWTLIVQPTSEPRPCTFCGRTDSPFLLISKRDRHTKRPYCDECIKEAPNELNPDWLRANDPYRTPDEGTPK